MSNAIETQVTDSSIATAELRESFNRAPLMRLRGWTFERACAAPLILWALKKSALARRRNEHLPTQNKLI